MPRTKDALSRYRIIDELLRKWRPVKTQALVEACSDRLGKPVSDRTIQKDIEDMCQDSGLGFYAPIKYDNVKRAYFYEEGAASILPPSINLTDEETTALLFYLKASNHYKEYKIFNKITDAISKVLDATRISDELKNTFKTDSILETEKILPLKGSELIYQLIVAVRERRKIAFEYKRFEDDMWKQRIMRPLLLKEASQMWYIIGIAEGKKLPVTFAIDRMRNLTIQNETFEMVPFNSTDHFKYSMGITVGEEEPVRIVLQFSRQQGNYIKALPIHETQKIIKDNLSGVRVAITIRPSYELYSKILGYGKDVTVTSPASVKNHVKSLLRAALRKY